MLNLEAQINGFTKNFILMMFATEAISALIWFAVMAGLIWVVWKLFGSPRETTHTIVVRHEPSMDGSAATEKREPTL